MKKEWKHIKGFENLYECSILGEVRTIPRVVIRSNGRPHTVRQRILKAAIDGCGYRRVGLMLNGKLVTRKVHRLVAESFLCSSEKNNEVNHINGIKADNTVGNLEWVTRSGNMLHAFKNGLAKSVRGESNPKAKITESQAIAIKSLLADGIGPAKISRDCSVSLNIVKDISRGRTWKHV